MDSDVYGIPQVLSQVIGWLLWWETLRTEHSGSKQVDNTCMWVESGLVGNSAPITLGPVQTHERYLNKPNFLSAPECRDTVHSARVTCTSSKAHRPEHGNNSHRTKNSSQPFWTQQRILNKKLWMLLRQNEVVDALLGIQESGLGDNKKTETPQGDS